MTQVLAQFCDDIRQEVGGKTTLVGVYQEVLIPDEIPCIIPKLCIFMTIITEHDIADVPIEVKYDEIILFSNKVTCEIQKNEWSDYVLMHRASLNIIFTPVHLQKEGAIEVRVKIGNKWNECGRLVVRRTKTKKDTGKAVPKKQKKAKR